jgi:hypothetical protein
LVLPYGTGSTLFACPLYIFVFIPSFTRSRLTATSRPPPLPRPDLFSGKDTPIRHLKQFESTVPSSARSCLKRDGHDRRANTIEKGKKNTPRPVSFPIRREGLRLRHSMDPRAAAVDRIILTSHVCPASRAPHVIQGPLLSRHTCAHAREIFDTEGVQEPPSCDKLWAKHKTGSM